MYKHVHIYYNSSEDDVLLSNIKHHLTKLSKDVSFSSSIESFCEFLLLKPSVVIIYYKYLDKQILNELNTCINLIVPKPYVWLISLQEEISIDLSNSCIDKTSVIDKDSSIDQEIIHLFDNTRNTFDNNQKNHCSRKCLIVDDEVNIRTFLRTLLCRNDFEVTEASDGNTAIENIQDNDYDIVIMDVYMPGITGIETLKRIKEIKPDQLIVMMTGSTQNEMIQQIIDDKDAVHCIKKPFDPDSFIKLINMFLVSDCNTSSQDKTLINDYITDIKRDIKKAGVKFVIVLIILSIISTFTILLAIEKFNCMQISVENKYSDFSESVLEYLKRDEERELQNLNN